MRIVITGADGFIGKNLSARIESDTRYECLKITRESSNSDIESAIDWSEAIIHLAGVNRTKDDAEFDLGNRKFTEDLCNTIRARNSKSLIIFASSIQSGNDTSYGESKFAAEQLIENLSRDSINPCVIFRLANVFGKWCKPNYNSVVSTFCHNICRGIPINISSPDVILNLMYIDDVVDSLLDSLNVSSTGLYRPENSNIYQITVAELGEKIESYHRQREKLGVAAVGTGLDRALYATYVSYLPTNLFSYPVKVNKDYRGVFVEAVKTDLSGQFSFFTALPGIVRGGHYHHTKVEKFLIIRGEASFRFEHILTNEYFEVLVTDEKPEIVESIPGWSHDVTNVGSGELIVMLWANEVFDPGKPDTYVSEII